MSHNIYKNPEYLDFTYSKKIAPLGEYPGKLGYWLAENAYEDSGSLIDVGCGRGDYLEVFKGMGFDVTGIDLSPNVASHGDVIHLPHIGVPALSAFTQGAEVAPDITSDASQTS